MMKTKLLFFFLVFAFVASAHTWYSRSYSDYMQHKWVSLDTLNFDRRSGGSKYWSGGGDFSVKTGKESVDKMLEKDVRFLLVGDSLYVNCRGLRCDGEMLGDGYARAYRFERDKVLILLDKNIEGGIFVNIAQGIKNTISPTESPRVCYLMTSDKKIVEKVTPFVMERLLEPYPSKQYEYKSLPAKEKESYLTIYSFLASVGQLFPY